MRRYYLSVIARACVLAAVLSLSVAIIGSPTVSAHAFVIGSDPVDGTTIAHVPALIRIFFNAPVSSASIVHVYAVEQGAFVEVATTRSSVASGNTRELDTAVLQPATLPQGSYAVKWVAVSNDDGHVTSGLIGFNSGFSSSGLAGTPELGPTSSNTLSVRDLTFTGVLAVVWQWFVLVALTLWVGIVLIERLFIRRLSQAQEIRDRTRKQTLVLQWLCLAVLMIGEWVVVLLRCIQLTQIQGEKFNSATFLQLVLKTHYGYIWIVRVLVLACALTLSAWQHRKQKEIHRLRISRTPVHDALIPAGAMRAQTTQSHGAINTINVKELAGRVARMVRPTQKLVWLALVVLLVLTYALTENAALIQQPHIISIVLACLSLLAQSIWLGGLAYAGFLLLPLLPAIELDRHSDVLVALLRCLAPAMLVSMVLVVFSYLFTTEMTITSLGLFFSDPYGRTLLVQWLLTLLLLPLTLYAIFALPRKLTRQIALLPVVNAELPARRARQSAMERTARRLRQCACVLSGLGTVLILCSALLSFFAPPIVFPDENYSNPAPAPSATTQMRTIGDLSVLLLVLPAQVGVDNTVVITLHDSAGKQVQDAQIQLTTTMLTMDMGTVSSVIKGGSSAYVVILPHTATFDMAGVWNLALRIQRPGQSEVVGTFQITVTEGSG